MTTAAHASGTTSSVYCAEPHGLQPARAIGERVARECVEGRVSDERVEKEEDPEDGRQRELDERGASEPPLGEHEAEGDEHDERNEDDGRDHVEAERVGVAAQARAREWHRDARWRDAKAHKHRERVEQLLDALRQGHGVDVVDLGGDLICGQRTGDGR